MFCGLTRNCYLRIKHYFSDLKCTIMEVKAIEGLGKAVDAILVNGRLKTNDIIVLGGQNGPICTHVKQIFTPPANKDQFNTNQFMFRREP